MTDEERELRRKRIILVLAFILGLIFMDSSHPAEVQHAATKGRR